jgi:hypothetical protein
VYSADRSVRRQSLIVAMTKRSRATAAALSSDTHHGLARDRGCPPRLARRSRPAQDLRALIDGQADAANQRIADALGAKDTEPEPGGEEDGEGEMAS